jgi:hypothetical protein
MRIVIYLLGLTILLAYTPGCIVPGGGDHHGIGDHHDDHDDHDMHDDHHDDHH